MIDWVSACCVSFAHQIYSVSRMEESKSTVVEILYAMQLISIFSCSWESCKEGMLFFPDQWIRIRWIFLEIMETLFFPVWRPIEQTPYGEWRPFHSSIQFLPSGEKERESIERISPSDWGSEGFKGGGGSSDPLYSPAPSPSPLSSVPQKRRETETTLKWSLDCVERGRVATRQVVEGEERGEGQWSTTLTRERTDGNEYEMRRRRNGQWSLPWKEIERLRRCE